MKSIFFIYSFFWIFCFNNNYCQVIVIDPGHSYDDVTSGYKSGYEVNTNWSVANKLSDMIERIQEVDWVPILTRNNNDPGEENNISLNQRSTLANSMEAQFPGLVYFLSIHCNASENWVPIPNGHESFYCNHTFNNNELLEKFAQNINENQIYFGEWEDRNRCVEDFTYHKDQDGNYFHLGVLKNLEMPNVLDELGFITNSDDNIKLQDDVWREKFALGYFEGLRATFSPLVVTNFSILNLPCFSLGNALCKIQITVKNTSLTSNYVGDLRSILYNFPYTNTEVLNWEFCQLGTDQKYPLYQPRLNKLKLCA
jgi:N-acetylmuramoyl-L-alanine amidase